MSEPPHDGPVLEGATAGIAGEGRPAHGATVSRIVERLRSEILDSRFEPAERLVEIDLTRRFGVSRGPVREALRRLAAEGLIEHVPNRGALVRRLGRDEIRELFQIRIELEALAARMAAAACEGAKRREFERRIVPIFGPSPREASDYMKENADFHSAVTILSGNRQLGQVATQLQFPLVMAQVRDALTRETMQDSVREHRAIAAAILTRDAAGAETAMRAHLRRAEALALAHAR